MTKELVEYIKNKKGQKIGCIVSIKGKYSFTIGWSLCRKTDSFNKEMALKIARNRAINGTNKNTPSSIKAYLNRMDERSIKYFKINNNHEFNYGYMESSL